MLGSVVRDTQSYAHVAEGTGAAGEVLEVRTAQIGAPPEDGRRRPRRFGSMGPRIVVACGGWGSLRRPAWGLHERYGLVNRFGDRHPHPQEQDTANDIAITARSIAVCGPTAPLRSRRTWRRRSDWLSSPSFWNRRRTR
jgi:hypothetical protein